MIPDQLVGAILNESSSYGVNSILSFRLSCDQAELDSLPPEATAYFAPDLACLVENLRALYPSPHLALERVFLRDWHTVPQDMRGPAIRAYGRSFFPQANWNDHLLILNEPVCHSTDPATINDILSSALFPRVLCTHEFDHTTISHPFFCHKSPLYPGKFWVISKNPSARTRADSRNLKRGSRTKPTYLSSDYIPIPYEVINDSLLTLSSFRSTSNFRTRDDHDHAERGKPVYPCSTLPHRYPIYSSRWRTESQAIGGAQSSCNYLFYHINQLHTADGFEHYCLHCIRIDRAKWLRAWARLLPFIFPTLSFLEVSNPSYNISRSTNPKSQNEIEDRTPIPLLAGYRVARRVLQCRPSPAELSAIRKELIHEYPDHLSHLSDG